MKKLRALWRFLFFVFYTCYKIGQMIFSSLLMGHDIRRSMRIRQDWSRYLLPTIGVQVKISGTAPDYPCIIMSNHRSYLDPAVLVYDAKVYGVSKAEVAKWPIIGFGAKNVDAIMDEYRKHIYLPNRAAVKKAHLSGFFFGYSQYAKFGMIGIIFHIATILMF